jgi:glycosyltransferase involved in cell wall biosynthesis
MSAPVLRVYDQAAVVIPARNERANLPVCLRAVLTAALCVPIRVLIVVVLDSSNDGSVELAGRYGPDVHFVSVDVRNVGAARAVGFGYARSLCGDGTECWYATTDADSRVNPGWLLLLEQGSPTDPAVPLDRAHSVPVSEWALARKHRAAQCFRSQFEPGTDGSSPVLPAFVLQRLLAVGEVVFR